MKVGGNRVDNENADSKGGRGPGEEDIDDSEEGEEIVEGVGETDEDMVERCGDDGGGGEGG